MHTHTNIHTQAGLRARTHTHTHMHTQYRFMDVIKRVNSEAHIFARVGSAADFKRTGSSAASNVVGGGVFAGGGDAAGSAPLPGGGGWQGGHTVDVVQDDDAWRAQRSDRRQCKQRRGKRQADITGSTA